MARLIIFGTGDAAELALSGFHTDTAHDVVAFCVDGAYLHAPHFLGLPVVAAEDVARLFPPAAHAAFVAIGYTRQNRVRAAKCAAMRALGYNLVSYISSRALIAPDLIHGDNCFVQEACVIQPGVRLGQHVTMWSGGHIAHHTTLGDNVFLAPRVAIAGRAAIGDGCFIGINATIRDHVQVGRDCVISAGAVVLANVADASLVPANAGATIPLPPRPA